jgi:hypothetical protein
MLHFEIYVTNSNHITNLPQVTHRLTHEQKDLFYVNMSMRSVNYLLTNQDIYYESEVKEGGVRRIAQSFSQQRTHTHTHKCAQ